MQQVYSYKTDFIRTSLLGDVHISKYNVWRFRENTQHSHTDLVNGKLITYENEVCQYKEETCCVQKVRKNVKRYVNMKRGVKAFDHYRTINTMKNVPCDYDPKNPYPSKIKRSNKLKLFRDTAIICQRRALQSNRHRKITKKFALLSPKSRKTEFGSLCTKCK